ncbi:MAG TPA: YihY/virulence factor BrkB family protein [Thermomicrobiales bacterium]|jgi:membrane protein
MSILLPSHPPAAALATRSGRSVSRRPRVRRIARALAVGVYRGYLRDNVAGLAAQVAYSMVFALPALLLCLTALASLVDRYTGIPVAANLRTMIDDYAPRETVPLLDHFVDRAIPRVGGGTASLGAVAAIVLALWGGTGGVAALVTACNRAYDVRETRPFLTRRLIVLELTVVIFVLTIAAFVLFVFGQSIGHVVGRWLGLSPRLRPVWTALRLALSLVFVLTALTVLYYRGSNVAQAVRWVMPGAALATVAWFLVLFGFRGVLALADPTSPYGAAGSAIVLLFFLYVSGLVFVVGAQVNAILGRRYDPATIVDLDRHPEKRLTAVGGHAARTHRRRAVRRGGARLLRQPGGPRAERSREVAHGGRDAVRAGDRSHRASAAAERAEDPAQAAAAPAGGGVHQGQVRG